MEYSSQFQPQQPAKPAPVPPGWYPDPFSGVGERYWDGIAWSQEFTRGGPSAETPAAAAVAASAPSVPTRDGLAPGTIAMAIGVILIIARFYYIWHKKDLTSAGGPYADGAAAGQVIGMFISAAVFSYGYNRYRSANESPTGTPEPDSFAKVLPLSLGITVAGLVAVALVG